jgi:hypothetical protein
MIDDRLDIDETCIVLRRWRLVTRYAEVGNVDLPEKLLRKDQRHGADLTKNSGTAAGTVVLHISLESAGGVLALVKTAT